MKPGDELRVRLVERISDTKARVVDVNNENPGTLMIKGNLKVLKDGTINAWVLQYDKKMGLYLYGNAYFGKFTISRSISEKYLIILRTLYDTPEKIVADDISFLKGMCNRCLRKDQWDWFTTYKYLGYPVHPLLREFVIDCIGLRDQLRNENYDNLLTFRRKYHNMFSSFMFHLVEETEVDEPDTETPILAIDISLWNRLSLESKKNIKMAERLHSKSSIYILMHYFVTLEHEFRNHFIQPFLDFQGKRTVESRCFHDSYKRTHDILIGKGDFTLGTVYYLGKFTNSEQARANSTAIKMFFEFLGEKKGDFGTICALISSEQINGMTLPKIRNGLAHGDSSVITNINKSTFSQLHACLLDPPQQILVRVLSNSKKFC